MLGAPFVASDIPLSSQPFLLESLSWKVFNEYATPGGKVGFTKGRIKKAK